MEHDDIEGRLPLPPRDFLILLALVDGPLHGYAIVKGIEADSEGSVRMDPANLYRALRRMERDNWVEEVEGEAEGEGEERRRRYGLTSSGRAVVIAETARMRRLMETARVRRLTTADPRR
jgi:DNA-binding PadR family transcriptional regulator